MKFTAPILKHDKTSVGRCKGHNSRLDPTASQLPKSGWFTKAGRHELVAWKPEVIQKALGLAKRKDAVIAIELVIQIGNQTDWREPPTPEYPCGKPAVKPASFQALAKAARQAVEKEFGSDNVVSIELHTDESTPHVHCVVVPIHDGKLQAKHWLDGSVKMSEIKARLHASVSALVPCEYERGNRKGGEPHDQQRAAGASPVPPAGILGMVRGVIERSDELKKAKIRIKELENEVQALFSKLKHAVSVGNERLDGMCQAESAAAAAKQQNDELKNRLQLEKEKSDQARIVAERTISAMRSEINGLKNEIQELIDPSPEKPGVTGPKF
jgi:hypothetical protein